MPTRQQVVLTRRSNAITGASAEEHVFEYDRAYWSHEASDPEFASQQTLMDELGQDMLTSTLEGFNNCLFAYGQTGSGKTYSVLGSDDVPENRGLLPRVVRELFLRTGTLNGAGTDFQCKAFLFAKDLAHTGARFHTWRSTTMSSGTC